MSQCLCLLCWVLAGTQLTRDQNYLGVYKPLFDLCVSRRDTSLQHPLTLENLTLPWLPFSTPPSQHLYLLFYPLNPPSLLFNMKLITTFALTLAATACAQEDMLKLNLPTCSFVCLPAPLENNGCGKFDLRCGCPNIQKVLSQSLSCHEKYCKPGYTYGKWTFRCVVPIPMMCIISRVIMADTRIYIIEFIIPTILKFCKS